MRQQQSRPEYTPGATVFAKLKGYPWWPARIESDNSVPARVLKQKSKTKGALYTVFFYGSRDYGFFGSDAIRPFDSQVVESDLKAKKFKTKDLEMAVRQALNPSLLAKIEDEEEDEDEGQEEEEEEDDEDKKPTKNKKKAAPTIVEKKKVVTATTHAKSTTAAKKGKQANVTPTIVKRRSRKLAIGDDVDETAIGETIDRKKRRKSMSMEKEDEEHESPIAHVDNNREDLKKSPEYKEVYRIRHKLQRLVYNKKEGEIPKEDYPRILQIVKEIEEAPMTYNLLKDTKIGKVVKAACSYPFEGDVLIKDRCQQIMKSWKIRFIDAQSRKSEDVTMHDV